MDQSQENTSTAVSRIAFSWLIHSYVSSILRPRVKSGSHLMLVPGAAWDCNSCTVWPSWKSMKSPKSNVYPCPPPESNFLDIAWCLDISPTFWFRGISCLITATGASHACDSVTEFSSSILSLTPKQVRVSRTKWFALEAMLFLNLLRYASINFARPGADWSELLDSRGKLIPTQQLWTESYCTQPGKLHSWFLPYLTIGFRTSPKKMFHLILHLAPAVQLMPDRFSTESAGNMALGS